MAKRDYIKLTYEAIWLKAFMDSGECYLYGKEIFVSPKLSGDKDRFFQMLGDVGAYARNTDFDKDIDVVVIANNLLSDLKEGDKHEFVTQLEELINKNNTPYRKLKFFTENFILDYLKNRAEGRKRQNWTDLNEGELDNELKRRIVESINKDEQLLQKIKTYKASMNEAKQRELF